MTREFLEHVLQEGAQWLRLAVEMTGAVIVGIGAFLAISLYLRSVVARKNTNFNAIRLVLARYLALALEFQLGADILSTAVNPSTADIKRLAAIAVIRTGLNYFLGSEIKEEQAAQEEAAKGQAAATRVGEDASGLASPLPSSEGKTPR